MLIAHCYILFIVTIPKFFLLANLTSRLNFSRISFRGFQQFDFLTRGFQMNDFISLINACDSNMDIRVNKGGYECLIFWTFPGIFLPYRLLRYTSCDVIHSISTMARVHLRKFQVWLEPSSIPDCRLLVEPSSSVCLM